MNTTPVANNSVAARRQNTAQLFVLDRNYRVLIGDIRKDPRYPEDLTDTIRILTQSWTDDPATHSEEIGLASPALIVRVFPLWGEAEWCIGVYAEPYRRRPTLAERAETLGLKPTEYELIRLLLEGLTDGEAASLLDIPESQLQASIALLAHKLGVHTADELIAKMAGTRR